MVKGKKKQTIITMLLAVLLMAGVVFNPATFTVSAAESTTVSESVRCYFKSTLTDHEKFIYNELVKKLYEQKATTNFTIDAKSNGHYVNDATQMTKMGRKAFNAFVNDYPEVFWISHYGSNDITCSNGVYTVRVTERYTGAFGDINTVLNGIPNIVNQVQAKISVATRYNTVKAIHDYLCQKVTYGDSNPKGAQQTIATLVRGDKYGYKLSCEGYTRSFKLLCDRFGIPAACVEGNYQKNEDGSGYHAWAYVQMGNNKWYAIDLAWDDGDTIKYKYWLMGKNTTVDDKPFIEGHNPDLHNPLIELVYPTLSDGRYVTCTTDTDGVKFSTQPQNATVVEGNNATFTVKAPGTGIKYQWYYKKTGGTTWLKWSGKTSSTLTVTPDATNNGMQVFCVANDFNNKMSSVAATLNVIYKAKITTQPKSVNVAAGKNLSISVKATGTGLKYQWYFKKKNSNAWSVWSGKTSATLTATASDAYNGMQVSCNVSGTAGNVVTSNVATINIVVPAKITANPASVAVGTEETVKFTVKATGTGLKYQWYFKKNGATSWSPWSGKTAATASATSNSTWDGMQVFCKVTDAYGYTASSSTAKVTLSRKLAIVTQPTNQNVVLGDSATLTVKAVGVVPTYQWYYMKKNETTWSKWNAGKTASVKFSPDTTWNGAKLYCLVKDRDNNSVKSNTITIKADNIIITTQPVHEFVKSGDTARFIMKALGKELKYQWYFMKKGDKSWTKWTGRTSASLVATANDSWNGMKVRCLITDKNSKTMYSNTVVVTICSDRNASTATNCTFTLKATEKSGCKYQWYYKMAGSTVWTAWSGKTTSTLSVKVQSSWNGMLIHCRVYDSNGIDSSNIYYRVNLAG